MNIRRVYTILRHTVYHLRYSMESWVDIFWFSMVDIVIFGLISFFVLRQGGEHAAQFLILGILLWEVTRVGQYSITVGAMWEIWSKSFSSLFVAPLTMNEFLAGQIISSFFKSVASLVLVSVLAYVLFGFSVLDLGVMVVVYVIELQLFAWAVGLFALAMIIRFGTDIQSLSWSIIFLFQPIGAFMYPVDVLPESIRWISYAVPVTYVTEAARFQLVHGRVNWVQLAIGGLLGAVYLLGSYFILHRSYRYSLLSGRFVRIES